MLWLACHDDLCLTMLVMQDPEDERARGGLLICSIFSSSAKKGSVCMVDRHTQLFRGVGESAWWHAYLWLQAVSGSE